MTSAQEEAGEDQVPVIGELTVYMTGYRYRGSNEQDGVAAISWDTLSEESGIDSEELREGLKVSKVSDSSVLSKKKVKILEDRVEMTPSKAGTVTVTFKVSGQLFAVNLTVFQPVMLTSALMYVKQKRMISVTGAPAGSKIRFASSNRRVAVINSKGKITAKASGNTVIYATVGTVRLGCVVSVATKKKVRAIKRATRIATTSRYSMPRRMKKGYYDCSSLVWRAYKPEGFTFGNKKFAPTAALEAKYLAGRKRIRGNISYDRCQKLRYRAGDVAFLTGARNGRYKGIYHVEMFRGYRYLGMTEAGAPAFTSLWVNRSEGRYDMGVAGIMGRP